MKTKIMEFFTNSAKVFLNPDELFSEKKATHNYDGVFSLIFYMAILGLIFGILTKSVIITVILIITLIIGALISKLIHSLITYVIAMIYKADAEFSQLYNLMCYDGALYALIIPGIGIALLTGNLIVIPLIILVDLWKLIVNVIAVNSVFEFGYSKSFIASYALVILILIIIMGLIL